jgi:hypothetical protein
VVTITTAAEDNNEDQDDPEAATASKTKTKTVVAHIFLTSFQLILCLNKNWGDKVRKKVAKKYKKKQRRFVWSREREYNGSNRNKLRTQTEDVDRGMVEIYFPIHGPISCLSLEFQRF